MEGIDLEMKERIEQYFKQLAQRGVFGRFKRIKIRQILGGDYNLNFKVILNNRNYLLRLNIEPQSGLKNQIKYEFDSLRALEPYQLAPKPIYMDDSKKFFKNDLLIEQFIDGKFPNWKGESLSRICLIIAKLHLLPVKKFPFLMERKDPLVDSFTFAKQFHKKYSKRWNANKKVIEATKSIIEKSRSNIKANHELFHSQNIVHTDLVPSNLIDNGTDIFIVDWEKARIDDASYDLAVFFSNSAAIWDSKELIGKAERYQFLVKYMELTGDKTIQDRLEIIEPFLNAYFILWAANRICDVEEGKIDPLLGKRNLARYKKLSNLKLIEKYLK